MYWQAEATRAGGPRRRPAGDDRGAADRRRRRSRLAARGRAARASISSPGSTERVRPSLAPHAIYTVSEESLRWIAEVGAEHGVPVQIHLSETAGRGRANASPTTVCGRPHYLDRLGMLGPRTLLAHGVWLDAARARADRRARRHRRHQPGRQHEARGRRRLPLPGGAQRRASRSASAPTAPARTTRSTSSPTSRRFALIQKHAAARPVGRSTPAEAWAIATGARAPLLGAGSRSQSASRPTSCCSDATRYELGLGDLTRRPRLRRLGLGRRHHRRRRPAC